MPEGEKLFAVGKIETGNLTPRERALKYFLAQSISSLIFFYDFNNFDVTGPLQKCLIESKRVVRI